MRRLLAILITILVGLPAVSPLFALATGEDPGRPVCCRRDGKHHCMLPDMDMSGTTSRSRPGFSAPTLSERCPYGAKSTPATQHPDWTLQSAKAIFAGVVAHSRSHGRRPSRTAASPQTDPATSADLPHPTSPDPSRSAALTEHDVAYGTLCTPFIAAASR